MVPNCSSRNKAKQSQICLRHRVSLNALIFCPSLNLSHPSLTSSLLSPSLLSPSLPPSSLLSPSLLPPSLPASWVFLFVCLSVFCFLFFRSFSLCSPGHLELSADTRLTSNPEVCLPLHYHLRVLPASAPPPQSSVCLCTTTGAY